MTSVPADANFAQGSVEDAVRADIEEWGASGSLAALAISLAHSLDTDEDSKSTAAIARELRATLAELAPKVDDDADADAALVAGLSSPVEHSKN